MEWRDHGIVLSTRPHGESSIVLELFTSQHGRHLGLVRGGRSRRLRPVLQMGNVVEAVWRARLSEHLGNYSIELATAHAATLMDDRVALAGISSLSSLAHLLPERDPHPGLYEAFLLILDRIGEIDVWPGLSVRWEFELLNELGFGLDLSECAATGTTENLIYVSPKSGRAVGAEAGEPYKDKLFKLPGFLIGNGTRVVTKEDIFAGFLLTGFFLEKHVMAPRGVVMPEARSRLLNYLQ